MQTLGEFIVKKEHDFPHATGELTALLSAIKLGAKIINRDINKAGLLDILGANGVTNAQGEAQTKLDKFANDALKAALEARTEVAGIASEEECIVIFKGEKEKNAKYVVLMDPLDGSSNIDVNVSVGTIFSIYRRTTAIGLPITEADFCNLAALKLPQVISSMVHQPCWFTPQVVVFTLLLMIPH